MRHDLISDFMDDYYMKPLSWDELMEVLGKIESMGYHTLIKTSVFTRGKGQFTDHEVLIFDGQDCVVEEDFSLPTKYDAVLSAITHFITWYNEQKQNNESTTENTN